MAHPGRSGREYERLKKLIYAQEICWICGRPVAYDVGPRHPLAPSVDHLLPIELGGTMDPGNLALAHYGCNSARGKGRPSATEKPRPRSRNY